MYTSSGAFTSKASAATNGTRSDIGSAKTSGAFPFGVVRRESEPYCAELIKYLWEATGSNRLFGHAAADARRLCVVRRAAREPRDGAAHAAQIERVGVHRVDGEYVVVKALVLAPVRRAVHLRPRVAGVFGNVERRSAGHRVEADA